jgi:hypothetical protein
MSEFVGIRTGITIRHSNVSGSQSTMGLLIEPQADPSLRSRKPF